MIGVAGAMAAFEACCHSASDAGRRIAPWETEFIDTIEVPA